MLCFNIFFYIRFNEEHTVIYPSMDMVLEYSKENDAGAPRPQPSKEIVDQIQYDSSYLL